MDAPRPLLALAWEARILAVTGPQAHSVSLLRPDTFETVCYLQGLAQPWIIPHLILAHNNVDLLLHCAQVVRAELPVNGRRNGNRDCT